MNTVVALVFLMLFAALLILAAAVTNVSSIEDMHDIFSDEED